MAVISQLTCASTAINPSLGPFLNQRHHRNPRRNHFPATTSVSFRSSAFRPITLKASAHNPERNSSRSEKSKPWVPRIPLSLPSTFKGNLFTATLFGAGANLLYMLLEGGGGGGRNNAGKIVRGGGGGGEAGQSSSFLSRLFSVEGLDKEDELESESEFYRVGSPVYMLGILKKYAICDVLFFDRKLNAFTDPTEDPLFKSVNIISGQVCTRSQLQKELDKLAGSGLFEEVDIDCKRNRDGLLRLRISFLERTWQQPAESFRCINVGMIPKWNPQIGSTNEEKGKKDMLQYINEGTQAECSKKIERGDERPCLLPMALQEEISDRLRRRKDSGEMSSRVLVKIKEKVQQWYDDHGYACAQVIGFGKLNTEELVCEVAEGDISRIQVVDASRNDSDNHHIASVVESALPYGLRKGEVFNIEDVEAAKLNIDALGLFSNTEIDLGLDKENGGGVVVKFKVDKKTRDDSGVSGRESFHDLGSS
ncbi:OLC1v1010939C1 [Oldenlandia corymbosa var. corymbosa]|uniref:OLC1v1010939C1 n=1 Tax=Oldenlandia corymbosa var. corymbosa TaxID=529605 RepID=A0AAV1DVI5_OLDCO|nr:OLC1v1010939C1 [Oldenlandia corymbosa var. corymbosa]